LFRWRKSGPHRGVPAIGTLGGVFSVGLSEKKPRITRNRVQGKKDVLVAYPEKTVVDGRGGRGGGEFKTNEEVEDQPGLRSLTT